MVVLAFGGVLIAVLARDLARNAVIAVPLSLLCGVVLCGLIVILPAKLAMSGSDFAFALYWFVPTVTGALAIFLLARFVRHGVKLPRPRLRGVQGIRDWMGAMVLLAFAVVVVSVERDRPGTVEIGVVGASRAAVELRFNDSTAMSYTMTASSPDLIVPLERRFVAPRSGTITFPLPAVSNVVIYLRSADGATTRRLFLP
jgi:hypothetical protein